MAKGYWVVTYNEVKDADKMKAYAECAGPVLGGFGGKYLVRGNPTKAYENGKMQRVVLIEFADLETAIAAHDSDGYQNALDVLGDGADRDIRVCEGME